MVRCLLSSSKVSPPIHIDVAPCQSRRLSLLSESLHRALIDLQKGRFSDKVHQLGVIVVFVWFGRPQQRVVHFPNISWCHTMRNGASEVGQMEGIILDRQASIASLIATILLSINITASNVPRSHIITAFARISKD